MAEDCIFCKIVKGELPSVKLYEDEYVLSFLDIMPAAEGHALVIPKKHCKTVLDAPAEDLQHVIKVAQKIGGAVMRATGAEGFNIYQSNNEVAGQIIPHVHFHVIPRKKGDGIKFGWDGTKREHEELKKYAEMLKEHL